MEQTDLPVGEPIRRRAGVVIVASLAVVAVFAAITVTTKELPAFDLHQPWQDDPYDVPVSLDFVILPMLVVLGLVRVQLCRRDEPLSARRVADLLRLAGAALAVCLATAGAEWVAVMLGLHRDRWTASTSWQVAVLAAFTVATIIAAVLGRRVSHALRLIARPAAQPDLLADVVTVVARVARVIGHAPEHSPEAIVRWMDAQLVRRVRARPLAAAALCAVILALPFVAAKLVLEGYPLPLVMLVFVFLCATLFAVIVVIGAYLHIVERPRVGSPAWVITVLVACTAGAVAFALHDTLLSGQSVAGLSALYFGAFVAAGAISAAVQALWRLHTRHMRRG